jgi:hypothetical protein
MALAQRGAKGMRVCRIAPSWTLRPLMVLGGTARS